MRATIFRAPRLLIVGGGYVGLYSALGLEKRLRPGEAEITLVSRRVFMVVVDPRTSLLWAGKGKLRPTV